MNRFEPANLSPLPKAPYACAIPYNLTWDNLQSILPDFDRRGHHRPQAFASHEKQGMHGGANSCILTLCYPTGENQFQSKTIFIKHTADPEKREAQKYQFLASQGVPTPHLLAAIHRNGGEIILLEFLPTIGINFGSASEVNSMLYLAAQLNSIQDRPLLFEGSPQDPRADAAFDETVHIALAELSRDPSLSGRIDVRRWFHAYQITQTASRAMPRALNHDEFYFQQVGWTEDNADKQRQLVMFDLETLSLRPRFTDIAGVLYPLSVYTGRDQVELFKVYLDRLHELTQIEVDIDEALRELRLLRVTVSCHSLPWLVNWSRGPDAPDDVLSMTMSCMRDDLMALQLL